MGTPNPLSRRSFLSTVAVGTGTLAAGPLLAGCSGDKSGATGGTDVKDLGKVLPAYAPSTLADPDIPSVHGSDPGYLKYPTDLVKTVTETPGKGGTYDAVTPLWGSIPPTTGNKFYEGVNKALGATLNVKPASGNDYGTMLPTMISGDKLPDWIDIPGWEAQKLNFGKAVEQKFADLTPYLSGDNIKKYPNLAAIPTAGWQVGVWNGKLYGIPVFSSAAVLVGALYYRKDIFTKQGVSEPKSADELFALGKEFTNPKAKRWAFDDLWTYLWQPFDCEADWVEQDGKLLHKYETENFVAAMEFMRKIVKAGYVHPEAIAQTGDGNLRFTSGRVVIKGDGTGSWGGMVEAEDLKGNKAFQMQAMNPFSANGTDAPRERLGDGAGLFSYLNKKLSKDQIEEVLRIANFLAAPFGTYEYTLTHYGVENVNYTMSASGPTLTDLGKKEVAETYPFLASPPNVISRPGYPDYVKAYSAWQANALQYGYKWLFAGQNITQPSRYAGIGQSVEDIIVDVNRNRKTIEDFKAAVDNWRKKGGEELRTFYTKIRDEKAPA